MMETSARATPLWPARPPQQLRCSCGGWTGHLPLKRGDQPSWRPPLIFNVAERAVSLTLPISPLEGEMSGRTEGGALAHSYQAKERQ